MSRLNELAEKMAETLLRIERDAMETRKEQIERLKKNEKLLCRLGDSDKEVMSTLGWRYVVTPVWTGTEYAWQRPFAGSLTKLCVYRIKQNYQVEVVPNYQKRSVHVECNELMVHDLAGMRIPLLKALTYLNFMYFEYEDGRKCMEPRRPADDGVSGPALYPRYVVFSK